MNENREILERKNKHQAKNVEGNLQFTDRNFKTSLNCKKIIEKYFEREPNNLVIIQEKTFGLFILFFMVIFRTYIV